MAPSSAPERLIRIVDEHWMIYVIPLFFCFVVLAAGLASLYAAGVAVHHTEWVFVPSFLLGTLLVLLALHGLFIVCMNEALSQIIITSKRVVHFDDSVLFKEDMLEVNFEKMKAVEVKKHGILPSFLNYGTLVFEGTKARIDYVPHPNSVARDIYQVMGML